MTLYRTPLTDMFFHMEQSNSSNKEIRPILEQAAKFCEEVLAPANASGDTQGCSINNGVVKLPEQTNTAFTHYVKNGWMGLSMPEQFGGQEMPYAVSSKVSEMITSTNHALSMIPALTMSACKALIAFGSEELKNTYLPKMVEGKWTGTMCMTEPHCGSDLGLLTTSAESCADGTFSITGTKIFISAGEQDASENIIHLVLARLKDSPSGIKGLSLFLVPKILPETNTLNGVTCIGIEEKMGIHANPTCSLSFEGAKGFLVGEANKGINAMFTMMNEMRLGTALQGVGLSEQSFQKSYQYAIDRAQGKALDRNKQSTAPADALISHADIRRMLLTQKAFAEGGRALCHFCSQLLDQAESSDAQDKEAEKLLGLLTPIAKAFLTETGLESASLAIQVYGGHGYIKETGVEQIYRDGRIATLYEGTTGIQALDLLGRKVLGDQGKALLLFTKKIYKLCKQVSEDDSLPSELRYLAETLSPFSKEWPELSQKVGMKAMSNHDEVGAAAYDFLMYSGYVALAYFWLDMSVQTISSECDDTYSEEFLSGKRKSATFYFKRLLPRAESHKQILLSGRDSISEHSDEEWLFT